ncbi:MAG: DUF1844 domain-containing protein [Myxococcota bacterium]
MSGDTKPDAPAGSGASMPAAPVGFSDLILSIAANAVAHLGGESPSPDTVPSRADLQLAAHHVDMLAMLKVKTRGNLEPEEENLLGTLLYELRMKYLEAAQRS